MSRDLDALRAIHDSLWDSERGLARVAPGVVPGVDISAFNLHAVRESALGSFLDLQDGRLERANVALREVLRNQYLDVDTPWFGTFRVTAEQADPPSTGAVEWFHYDPNWRQFLGCILAQIQLAYSEVLDADVSVGIDHALEQCVRGEPEGRIPDWYTNPILMHAWLSGHVGSRIGDRHLVDQGERLRDVVVSRFRAFGDLDEYNSPTYDGIDLFALLLWVVYPPSTGFEAAGNELIGALTRRISALFHPSLAVQCGPYIRTYGLRLKDYVSLVGVWLNIYRKDCDVLPTVLDSSTDHVHDLYFAPVFRYLGSLYPELSIPSLEPDVLWLQDFGESHSRSLRTNDRCYGVEAGRRHEFAQDQYAPVVLHWSDDDVGVASISLLRGGNSFLDASMNESDPLEITGSILGSVEGCAVRLMYVKGMNLDISGGRYAFGSTVVNFDQAPLSFAEEMKGQCVVASLSFEVAEVGFKIHVM